MNEYHHNLYILVVVALTAFSVVGVLIWEMIKSQLRFQAICDNSGNMVIIGKAIVGKSGMITDIELVGCNEVYAHHLHMEVKDLIGLRVSRDFYDGKEPEWLDIVRDVIITHESRHLDFSYEPLGTRYTGSVFCLSSIRKRCCFLMEETSADYKRRSELSRVRNLMDMILEMSGIAMWEWNLISNNINVIKTSIKIVSEYASKDISLSDIMEKIHPDDRKALISLKTNLPGNNKPASPVEYRFRDRQGEWRWFQAVAVKANFDKKGVVESLVGVTFDIDSLKRSQLKVQEISKEFEINQKWLMYSLQQSRTGYCRWDLETDQFHYSDNFWQSVGGLTEEEEAVLNIPDKMSDFRKLMVAEDPEEFNGWLDSIANGESVEYEFRCHLSFLPERFFEVRANVIEKNADGKAMVVSGFIIDITEIRKKEEALRKAMELADEANKAKGRFLAVMSHEIRTPLNAIIGFGSMLQESDISRQLKSYAESIKNSGEMLLHLINDLLDLAKIESAKMELKFEPVDLFNLLSELKGMFELKVNSKQLYLNLHCNQDLPLFNLDRKRIQQIFVNLIGNAVKFTSQGGVVIDVIADPYKTGGMALGGSGSLYQLEISVSDTGEGIPEKDFEKIFNPFEQATNNHDNYVEGTGLGLAICRNLVELMGGTLTFQSNVGKGSNFVVTLAEVESVTRTSDLTAIDDAAPSVNTGLDDSFCWKYVLPETIARLQSRFGERFADLTTGLHVQAAHALVEDLDRWMAENNAYELKDMIDCLRQAVNDFNVTEVRRAARMFIEWSDGNGK